MRFEVENGGPIVIATMCLLETSRHGLLETEILQMLADESNLTPLEYKEGSDEIPTTKPTELEEAPGKYIFVNATVTAALMGRPY